MRHLRSIIAVAAVFGALAPAQARTLSCDVPRIEVCDGCLRKIIVTLRPGGTCRVTYEIAPASAGDPAPRRLSAIAPQTIVVEEPHRSRRAWVRPARRHRAIATVSRARESARPCFAFNGQRFCE